MTTRPAQSAGHSSLASSNHGLWYRRLDRLFWLAWLGLPVMIWAAYSTLDDPRVASQLPPELANCATLIPRPAAMTPTGRALFWGLFLFQISIYFVLLGFLHRIVARFARGHIFVGETLASLHWLGVILIAWPVLEFTVTQLALASLKRSGDIPVHVPSYAIDVAPLAVGFFLIALRLVLAHAIAIKSEHDLTV